VNSIETCYKEESAIISDGANGNKVILIGPLPNGTSLNNLTIKPDKVRGE
jgi:hypothetical protein